MEDEHEKRSREQKENMRDRQRVRLYEKKILQEPHCTMHEEFYLQTSHIKALKAVSDHVFDAEETEKYTACASFWVCLVLLAFYGISRLFMSVTVSDCAFGWFLGAELAISAIFAVSSVRYYQAIQTSKKFASELRTKIQEMSNEPQEVFVSFFKFGSDDGDGNLNEWFFKEANPVWTPESKRYINLFDICQYVLVHISMFCFLGYVCCVIINTMNPDGNVLKILLPLLCPCLVIYIYGLFMNRWTKSLTDTIEYYVYRRRGASRRFEIVHDNETSATESEEEGNSCL